MGKYILEKLLSSFKSARRIVSLFFLFLMMITIIVGAFQLAGIEQFIGGIVALIGVVAVTSGLAYTHANTIPEPGRTWINREARNLFQGVILLVYAAALSWILVWINKFIVFEAFQIIFNVITVVFLAALLLGGFYWIISSIEYISDALGYKESIEEVEKRYTKNKGRLNALLGRISFKDAEDT